MHNEHNGKCLSLEIEMKNIHLECEGEDISQSGAAFPTAGTPGLAQRKDRDFSSLGVH
jgi:hypothetical protein